MAAPPAHGEAGCSARGGGGGLDCANKGGYADSRLWISEPTGAAECARACMGITGHLACVYVLCMAVLG